MDIVNTSVGYLAEGSFYDDWRCCTQYTVTPVSNGVQTVIKAFICLRDTLF